MSVFSDFKAYPETRGNALYTNWSFISSFIEDVSNNSKTPQFLYIYVTDYNAVAAGNTISAPLVIPLRDTSGKLTTNFSINNSTPNMSFLIENGQKYHLMAQIVYQDNSNIISSNSAQAIVTCSTIPQVPNFTLTAITDAFEIKLVDGSGSNPTPISEFDGYGTLKGIFVTYASGTQLYSKYISNDASNNLYSRPQKIDASLNTYEVSVASYNYSSDTGADGKLVTWGGRSNTSLSKLVVVDDTPGPVRNLSVYETMADFSMNMTQASTYTTVSNTIKWDLPNVGASSETIEEYNIYRNNVLIDTIPKTAIKYVDDASNLQVNVEYIYIVAAVNSFGEGTRAPAVSIRGVVFPTQTSLVVDPSGSQSLSMTVSNVTNGFPLANYLYDFSYNGIYETDKNNPYLATGLSNNTTYNVQSTTNVRSVNASGVTYTTSFWTPPVQAVPYNPVAPSPRDLSGNPLDASGNPSGTVLLSWFNSDVSNVGFSGQLSYTLSYAIDGSPDASYVIQQTANCISNTRTIYTMPANILTLGTAYQFRVFNTLNGTGIHIGKIAVSPFITSGSVTPFVVPGPVRSLALTNPTTTDMSYSWLPPVSNGGLSLSAYRVQLRLLNDGSNVLLNTKTTNDISGNLSTLFEPLQQGSQYQLIVSAGVTASSQVFYGQTQSAINFTIPTGLNTPNATNVTNGTLLNGIQINWGENAQYQELDASNATFNIYRNGSPIILATGVRGISYLDTTPIIGSNNYYQVVPVVNSANGTYVPGSVPSPSATVKRMQLPAQPTNINVTSRTSNSVNFSWTASTGGSGNDASLNYLWSLTDGSGNIDASGVTTGTSINQTGLDNAGVYTIRVRSGVVNPFNNIIYYNNTSVPQTTAPLYGQVPQAGFITVFGSQAVSSDGALLLNLTDASSVVGLTFSFYKIELSTDASFINNLITQTSTSSEFYVSGLTNGTNYFVRAYNIYTDVLNNSVLSPVSSTSQGTPTVSPAQPLGVLANTESAYAITVYWNFPSQETQQPSSYALNIGTDPSNIIPTNITFEPLSDFSSNATQFFKTITGLTFGKIYYINVIAGIQTSNSIAVSQPSAVVSAVPYTTPSAPLNLNNIPGDTTIISSWDAPSTTGGAGIGLNGTLLYRLQLSQDPSFSSIITDISGISDNIYTFSGLITNTIYNVRVRAYFEIQGSTSNLAIGSYAVQLGIQTQSLSVEPTISNVTGDNTLGQGGSQQSRTVLVDFTIDSTKACSIDLRRRILDPTGTNQLAGYTIIASLTLSAGNSGSGRFTDTGNFDSGNFLNGNMMQYIIDVTYTIIGGSPYTTSTLPSVMAAPYGRPIPTNASGDVIDLSSCIVPISPDASGGYTSFTLRINKNGSDLNSLVAVGLSNVGEQAYVISQSPQLAEPNKLNIVYNNVQVNGKIAENQYGEYVLTYAGVPSGTKITNTLVIENNKGGALLAKNPNNGTFGPNQAL